ncbi:MAG: hypothetical protein ACR2J1_10745 [Methyloceanibacter sp.]|uniref:hypothetical protein n=1 Tax=Methyloceanibacter sp. TaxID=1965321 RepID=UPI003D9AE5C6
MISKLRFNLPLCALGAGAIHALLLAVALPMIVTLPGAIDTAETGAVESAEATDTPALAIDTGPPIVDPRHIDVEIVPVPETTAATAATDAPPSAGPTVVPDLAQFAAEPAPIATPIPEDALQQQGALPEPAPAPTPAPVSATSGSAAEMPTGSIDTDAAPPAATEPTAAPVPEITPADDDDVAEPPASAAPSPAEDAVATVVPAEPAPPLPRRKPKFAAVKPPPPPTPAKTATKPKIQRKEGKRP